MMAAEEQTMTSPATERAHRSDADRRRAVDALLRDPLWSLLTDEAIASIAETSPGVVRDRRAILNVASLSTYRDGDLA
jgi:hypothetical protein